MEIKNCIKIVNHICLMSKKADKEKLIFNHSYEEIGEAGLFKVGICDDEMHARVTDLLFKEELLKALNNPIVNKLAISIKRQDSKNNHFNYDPTLYLLLKGGSKILLDTCVVNNQSDNSYTIKLELDKIVTCESTLRSLIDELEGIRVECPNESLSWYSIKELIIIPYGEKMPKLTGFKPLGFVSIYTKVNSKIESLASPGDKFKIGALDVYKNRTAEALLLFNEDFIEKEVITNKNITHLRIKLKKVPALFDFDSNLEFYLTLDNKGEDTIFINTLEKVTVNGEITILIDLDKTLPKRIILNGKSEHYTYRDLFNSKLSNNAKGILIKAPDTENNNCTYQLSEAGALLEYVNINEIYMLGSSLSNPNTVEAEEMLERNTIQGQRGSWLKPETEELKVKCNTLVTKNQPLGLTYWKNDNLLTTGMWEEQYGFNRPYIILEEDTITKILEDDTIDYLEFHLKRLKAGVEAPISRIDFCASNGYKTRSLFKIKDFAVGDTQFIQIHVDDETRASYRKLLENGYKYFTLATFYSNRNYCKLSLEKAILHRKQECVPMPQVQRIGVPEYLSEKLDEANERLFSDIFNNMVQDYMVITPKEAEAITKSLECLKTNTNQLKENTKQLKEKADNLSKSSAQAKVETNAFIKQAYLNSLGSNIPTKLYKCRIETIENGVPHTYICKVGDDIFKQLEEKSYIQYFVTNGDKLATMNFMPNDCITNISVDL